MSDQGGTPSEQGGSTARQLSIRMPSDDRYRVVLETAVRIYLRPVCRTSEGVPEVASALVEMVAEVAGDEPIDVVLDCSPPQLDVSVASGGRRRARTFRFEVSGQR